MNESLLREIIIRVLADPRFQPLLAAADRPRTGCEGLIVVENREGFQAVPELQQRWGLEYSLTLCVAGPSSVPEGILPQVSWEQAMAAPKWARIFLPVCSGRQLAQIAVGLSQDRVAELAGWAVLQGIPVEIGCVDYGFTERTPEAYRALLTDYARQVAAYGVTIGDSAPPAVATPQPEGTPRPQEMPWSFGEPVGDRAPKAPDIRPTVSFDDRLLSEKDAILLPKHAVLLVAKGTVLTPSAIDIIKKQKVEVFREGVRYL